MLVPLCDVCLQSSSFNTPLSAAADLDRRQFAAAYEGVHLSTGHVEHLCHIGKGEKAHGGIVPKRSGQRDSLDSGCG